MNKVRVRIITGSGSITPLKAIRIARREKANHLSPRVLRMDITVSHG
jgi:hypothetical protein